MAAASTTRRYPADGRTLSFKLGSLAAGGTTQLRYVVEVAAGARLGEAVNTAMAADNAGNGSNYGIGHGSGEERICFVARISSWGG